MLSGYKTYIIAAVMGLVFALEFAGVITPDTAKAVEGLLIASGLMTLRAGVQKSTNRF